jgi:hypothetical protein
VIKGNYSRSLTHTLTLYRSSVQHIILTILRYSQMNTSLDSDFAKMLDSIDDKINQSRDEMHNIIPNIQSELIN